MPEFTPSILNWENPNDDLSSSINRFTGEILAIPLEPKQLQPLAREGSRMFSGLSELDQLGLGFAALDAKETSETRIVNVSVEDTDDVGSKQVTVTEEIILKLD